MEKNKNNGFTDIKFEDTYRSGSHIIGRDFMCKILCFSKVYKRAAGYFSSNIYLELFYEYLKYFKNGGHIELITSPVISRKDYESINKAIFDRQNIISKLDIKNIINIKTVNQNEYFAWLIASGYIKIKFAVVKNKIGEELYHEKIGVFIDNSNNYIAFSGSSNESMYGYFYNYERIDVFSSIGEMYEKRKARFISNQFKELWENKTEKLNILTLYESLKNGIITTRPTTNKYGYESVKNNKDNEEITMANGEILSPPNNIQLMEHQRLAISEWAQSGGSGIIEMATGSGKTITALYICSKIYDNISSDIAIIIVAPYIHLVDQWRDVSKRFGLSPIRCAEGYANWADELNAAIYALNSGSRKILSLATTIATFSGNVFQEIIKRIQTPIIIIADEVHNYATENYALKFPEFIKYRVGLTATYESGKSERLDKYFNKVVYSYSIKEALKDNILTPYRYFPLITFLDSDETEEYVKLTKMISRYLSHDSDDLSDVAKSLLLKRARLIASAKKKIPMLKILLQKIQHESHILVYCGDGTVEGPEDQELVRQVEEVVRVIGNELKMLCASYTARTESDRRKMLVKEFENGNIQVLVAIRCLDEGVDIPNIRKAYILASSANLRQFIQRRGRLLRKYSGKNYAEIYDFFVTPLLSEVPEYYKDYPIMRNLIKKELYRAEEFAGSAENGPAAMMDLLDIKRHFNIF